MNDDQLSRLFRSLEHADEPSPDFADALLARLEGETARATARRRSSLRWALLAATLLLVAGIGAGLAIGAGLLKLPAVVSVASAAPLPSGSRPPSAGPSCDASLACESPQETPAATAAIPEPTTIDHLVATRDGFLAIGSAPNPGGQAVILRASADGSAWQPIDGSGFGRIIDAAAGSSSEIILANTSPAMTGKYIVWRSTDGEQWTPDATWTAAANPQPTLTVAGPAGFMILGPTDSPTSDVWTSSDATTWSHGSIGPAIDGAVVLDAGFLAYSQADRQVFASLDGLTWNAVASPVNSSGNQTVRTMFMVGSTLIALTCPMEPSSCSLWNGTLGGTPGSLRLQWTAASDAQLMNGYAVTAAAGTTSRGFLWGYDLATYGRVAWTSRDGKEWSRFPLADAALGAGMPALFAAGPSAAVAVGWTDGTALGAGRELWQSADGVSWTPASGPPVPPAPQVPAGSCPSSSPTLQELIDIGFAKAASCYGQGSLTIRAYSSDCGGCGGTGGPRNSPGWIANGYAPWYVSPTPPTPTGPGTRVGVWLLPSAHLTLPKEGVLVEITGHFNDPVSQDCRITPTLAGGELPPVSDATAACRQAFVVSSIAVLGG